MLRPAGLLFLVFLVSCHSDPIPDCFNSTGPEQKITRILPVHPGTVEIKDNVDVVWHRSDSSYLVLTCGRNLAKKVITDVKDGNLTIGNINKCNWVREYNREMKVDLFCREPKSLYLKGYGEFRCADTLWCNKLAVYHYGAGSSQLMLRTGQLSIDFNCIGHMTLNGNSQTASYYTQDVGILKATGLKVNTLEIKVEGDNDVWVDAQDSLKGALLTSRTVFYAGKPKLAMEVKNGGKLVPINP